MEKGKRTKDIYIFCVVDDMILLFIFFLFFYFCQRVSTSNLPAYNNFLLKNYSKFENKNKRIIIEKKINQIQSYRPG